MPLPLCFSSVQFDLEPEVTARRSQIIIERHRTSTTSRKIPMPVVCPLPPPIYPRCTHTETQVIVAEPREREPEPASTILNININQAASEIAENLAKENMLRNQVAVLENSLDEERRARASQESARYEREVRDIYEERESRHRSSSRGERRKSRSREVRHETVTREVSVGYAAEEAARERISHEYHHRSSSHGRLASPRGSGERLVIVSEHSSPRHSRDRLAVTHTRSRSHEIRYHWCSFCNHHGHQSDECPESEPELVQVPVRRVRYLQV